ncbi:peptide-methionine (S)-S-oxide reductase [Maribacter halichondriae]|uniref:peptide-methionine (S)-S-oxide reductase n=1 Tax=Maribacter halichondriae TaxID=2980554 RepID=UPI002359C9D0|nr:peptide-methionine (S)-S-oxide reductase [Maribacter sp. Hal144]
MQSTKSKLHKIAVGGGCHWCTEAVYQSLKGVSKVEQGFISSSGSNTSFSEAVIVHFDKEVIGLAAIIEIHLHTHSSTSEHGMRSKYRSAVYTFSKDQALDVEKIINELQEGFEHKIITEVLPLVDFKSSEKQFANYYFNNPQKPFCQNYIEPKIQLLLQRFSNRIDANKIRRQDAVALNP